MKQLSQAFIIFLLLSFSLSAQSVVKQFVDRTDIHAGESFVFTIQVDELTNDQPDLSLLPKEFTVITSGQFQKSEYINGQGQSIQGWNIKLSTLKTGRLTIPAITIGNLSTSPIIINVKSSNDRVELKGNKQAIFVETSIDKKQVYVQQQIIFTIKLYRAVNTHNPILSEPTAGDSLIEKLGDDTQYDKTINNTRYVVHERRYAIFPQKSGSLEISAVNFNADVLDKNRQSLFMNSTRPISVSSQPIKLNVKIQPNSSKPWLPAIDVVLADKWTPISNQLTVGEPITWTLLLNIQGLSESQLPAITLPKVDGLQMYPDTPQKIQQINEQGVLSQRVEKLAVIPTRPGKITVPAIQLKWWDTNSDSEKTATIAEKTFNVVAAKTNANQTPTSEMIGPKQPRAKMEVIKEIVYQNDSTWWKISSAVLLILWALTLIAYFRLKTQLNRHSSISIKPSTQPTAQISSQANRLKALEQAIKNQELHQVESCLLQWASSLSNRSFQSLGQIIAYLQSVQSSKDLIDKMNQLQAQRYASNKDQQVSLFSAHDLAKLKTDFLPKATTKTAHKIPPLYKE